MDNDNARKAFHRIGIFNEAYNVSNIFANYDIEVVGNLQVANHERTNPFVDTKKRAVELL